MHHVFVYGTLQSPEIVEKLTGKSFKTIRAVLPGYRLYSVKDVDYPAIIKTKNAKTNGLLFENMDDFSLNIFLFYEGDEYELKKVTVFVDEKPLTALAFVWAKETELLEVKEWNLQEFVKNRLGYYLDIVITETLKDFNLK